MISWCPWNDHTNLVTKSKSITDVQAVQYSANVKDSENGDRWLAALFSAIVH